MQDNFVLQNFKTKGDDLLLLSRYNVMACSCIPFAYPKGYPKEKRSS
jgi:hypothetical protein